MSGTPTLTWPDTIARVTALEPRRTVGGFGLQHIPFAALYAVALKFCVETAGEPYALAVAQRAALAAEVADSLATDVLPVLGNATVDGSLLGNSTADVTSSSSSEVPLPNEALPAFWALLLLAVVVLAHSLLWFAQRWSVRFRASVQFRTAPRNVAVAGGYLLVEPHAHQGAVEVVRVVRAALSVHELSFEFQRQRFDVDTRQQRIEPLRCPVDRPLSYYIGSGGLSLADVPRVAERFGRNSVEVPSPTFLDIFLKQILGPVPVFQMFCTTLWLLDEYWNYAIFHFFMICLLEASTAFSRLKNVTSLKGMQTGVAEQVYVRRDGEWRLRSSADLLPGDVFSVPDASGRAGTSAGAAAAAAVTAAVLSPPGSGGGSAPMASPPAGGSGGGSGGISVPCDAVILSGSAVVNEASLTGESIPQLKEALVADGAAAALPLDINGEHRAHVLFSGTSVMQIDGARGQQQQQQAAGGALRAPDGGCVCVCLRTGFASSQGTLVRMIEYSSEQVMGSTKESITLLLILLMFAIAASSYVLYNGLHDKKRTQYQLVIRCVLIMTSVVPPELPMQMAVAVNTAILALWRAHVFCTEPFRVPYAGKLTAALFDKTGTLTTDQLQVVGVTSFGTDDDLGGAPSAASASASAAAAAHVAQDWSSATHAVELQPASKARMRVRMVLAACHSLVSVGDALMGDPTEMAASRAAGWKHDAVRHRTVPAQDSGDEEQIDSVQVLHTYRFASSFQRMSVLVRVELQRGAPQVWLLSKGSPEKVGPLCADAPPAFARTYRAMAESGHRVLALAWRRLSDSEAARVTKNAGSLVRDEAERGLHFLGLVAMSCLVRKDSALAVQCLIGGALRVAMVTGDASLTALHVARQVEIAPAAKPALMLSADADDPDGKPPHWELAIQPAGEPIAAPIPYSAAAVAQLAQQYALVVSGPALRAAERADAAGTHKAAPHIVVFARMTPSDKEMLLRWLRENDDYTLMCGDGANDVGALKQAHVGLALLSGFGTANTATEGEKMLHEQSDDERKLAARELAVRQAQRAKEMAAERAKDIAEVKELQTVYYKEELEKLEREGDAWAALKAMKNSGYRVMAETQRRNTERMRKYGGGAVAGAGNQLAAQAAWMAADMGGQDDVNGVPAVKLGDASVAAPFTSKLPSIRSCVDIVRQGRCTLVSTVQNQQIMSLNAMITAYSLSALAIDGVRFGEVQMIATSLLLSVAGIAFTYARPVDQLAPTQPIGSIFHPAMALSTIGQLVIHLSMMVLAIQLTRAAQTGNEVVAAPYEPEWLKIYLETVSSGTPVAKKFKPALLNTVVFLVETAQQVAVMAVNYKGRPFMLASTENAPMLISLTLCGVGLFTAASEHYPLFNGTLRLVQLPNDEFRYRLLAILSVSVFGAFLWDRLIVAIFAPKLFVRGYVDAYRALPTLAQLAHKLSIWLFWLAIVVLWASLDSLLVLLGAWWFWRSPAMLKYRGIEPPIAV
jgi:cation-transporting ATPase 13A1